MRVLVISAHPDDDAIGCGGAILNHRAAGDDVHLVYASAGELGCPDLLPDEAARVRRVEAKEAAISLDATTFRFWRFRDREIDQAVISRMAGELFREMDPDMVYTPHQNDDHPDHRAVAWGVRNLWDEGTGWELRQFEIWTPLAQPNQIVDITAVVSTKRWAITRHTSQHSRNPFCEAILALNHYRGLMMGPNKMYAEAFQRLPL